MILKHSAMNSKTKIDAFDEFGFILWYHAPRAYSEHLRGNLDSTNSKIGSRPVFFFSEHHFEYPHHNESPFHGGRECYNHTAPAFTNSDWVPPPYKERFKNEVFKFDKPLLTINNKNTLEWDGSGIFNYFDAAALELILNTFYDTHQIVYIRPPVFGNKYGYQKDDKQGNIDIGDEAVLSKFPEVLYINNLLEDYDFSYNTLQFMLLANSDRHISCAGDSVVPAYFGGELLSYGCPNCPSKDRGVWKTGSWMEKLSGSKIYGFTNINELINKGTELWL